jgi:GNAT superfamily N-acetyltransferase
VEVRAARVEEIPLLREIERRAGATFAGIGLDVVAEEEAPPAEVLAAHVEAGTAWVAAEDGLPVGYAIASLVDGEGHLDQVSVLPEHGRRGIGRALVEGVCAWAAERGLHAVTLTTYREVPWNGPLWARYGFSVIEEPDHGSGLAAIRAEERRRGLDVLPRIAMRRVLGDPP